MTTNIFNLYRFIILIFLPALVFSQTGNYRNKAKSPSFAFLTELDKTYYVKDYIVKATKLGYELNRNKYGEFIYKSNPANFILLTKKIDDDDHFPPWAVGQILKKVFFTKDNLEENPIQLCVITEIFLIEYENISQSSIKNFYNSTTDFILEHIKINNKVNSTITSFENPLYYLWNENKYPFVNIVNYSFMKNDFEFKNSFSYSQRSETNFGNDGRTNDWYYLGFQHNTDIWDGYISVFEMSLKASNNKKEALKNLRNNIGDKNIEEINTYDLQEMVQFFLDDCKRSNINVPSIKTLSATFEPLEEGVIALAFGMNNDDQIVIRVDPTNWQKSDLIKKWYVIYHELGHDVLNLDHGEGGKMMFNFADREYTWDEFYNDKDYMFNYVLKNNKF